MSGLSGAADAGGDGSIETTELAANIGSQVPLISLREWRYQQFPMFQLQGQSFPIGLHGVGGEAER